jgi:hypothetical protein
VRVIPAHGCLRARDSCSPVLHRRSAVAPNAPRGSRYSLARVA